MLKKKKKRAKTLEIIDSINIAEAYIKHAFKL